MTDAESNTEISRDEQMRHLLAFMLDTEAFETQIAANSQPRFVDTPYFGAGTLAKVFSDVLESNHRAISSHLQALGGIPLAVRRRDNNQPTELRLIGWTGLAGDNPDRHRWHYGPRPEQHIDVNRSFLTSLAAQHALLDEPA